MNTILGKIESVDSFDELGNLLQSKDLIKDVHDFIHKINTFNNVDSDDNIDDDTDGDESDNYQQTIKKQKITRTINVRESRLFLIAYMISRFPQDTFGSIGQPNEEGIEIEYSVLENGVHSRAVELIEYSKTLTSDISEEVVSVFTQLFQDFVKVFNIWKIEDQDKLKTSLIHEYHQLSVNIMNEMDRMQEPAASGAGSASANASSAADEVQQHNQLTEERIQVLEQCKESLLETALLLGGPQFVDEIGQYSPVVIDVEELCKAYGNAFWDVLGEEYGQKKYDKIFVVLENILKLFESIYDDDGAVGPAVQEINTRRRNCLAEIKEKLDIDFIRQRLEHNIYSTEEMYNLCKFIILKSKALIAPQFDDNIETISKHLEEENFLPLFLREISMILQITVSDTISVRKAIRVDSPQPNGQESA